MIEDLSVACIWRLPFVAVIAGPEPPGVLLLSMAVANVLFTWLIANELAPAKDTPPC